MALPFVYAAGLDPSAIAAATLVLPANGGAVAIPFPVVGGLICQSGTVRTTDTSGVHTLEMGLYLDGQEGGNGQSMAVQGSFNAFTFTATVAVVRTGPLSQPVLIQNGTVWLVIRNAGGTTTTLAAVAPGTLGGNHCGTATLAQSLALGLGTPTWARIANIPLVRLNGSIIGLDQPGATLN